MLQNFNYTLLFSDFNPNVGALKALDELIACGVTLGKISKNYQVIGHRQGRDTVCPGEVFYNYVMAMPNWTSTPIPIITKEFNKLINSSANTNVDLKT